MSLLDVPNRREFLVVRDGDVTGKKHPTSFLATLMHCLNAYIGIAIFLIGSAFTSTGIILGCVLLILVALLNLHCQCILLRACLAIANKEDFEVFPSYGETVQYTFEDSNFKWLKKHSKIFGLWSDIFIILAEYAYCVLYLLFASKYLREIGKAFEWEQDYRIPLAIILLPMWISTFLGSLKVLSPISLISNAATIAATVLILKYVTRNLPPIDDRLYVSDIIRTPAFLGTAFLLFQGITFIILPLRSEMKNPGEFTTTLGVRNLSIFITTLLSLIIGTFTFWYWGDEMKEHVLLGIPLDENLCRVTYGLIILCTMFTYTLHMYIAFEIFYPRFYKRWSPFNHPRLVMYTYKSIAVVITYCLANTSPKVIVLTSVVGGLTGTILTMFIPPLLELVMLYGRLTYFIIIKDIILIMLAFATLIIGGIVILLGLLETTEL